MFRLGLLLTYLTISCNAVPLPSNPTRPTISSIDSIPLPEGFHRVTLSSPGFGHWLRGQSIRKDNTVYLFNGTPKSDQDLHYAVLNWSVGKKDLQQCADAVMRLRAEYLFEHHLFDSIVFFDNEGGAYKWKEGGDRKNWQHYLDRVFGMCGTASLSKQMKQKASVLEIMPGDVFIRGGFPGHAMIVMDVVVNDRGEKKVLLAQSYMPAQDIHIVKDPLSNTDSPWIPVPGNGKIYTPEWVFTTSELKQW